MPLTAALVAMSSTEKVTSSEEGFIVVRKLSFTELWGSITSLWKQILEIAGTHSVGMQKVSGRERWRWLLEKIPESSRFQGLNHFGLVRSGLMCDLVIL